MHHILYVIIDKEQKISGINFSPMRAGGEIGENFQVYGTLLVHVHT